MKTRNVYSKFRRGFIALKCYSLNQKQRLVQSLGLFHKISKWKKRDINFISNLD